MYWQIVHDEFVSATIWPWHTDWLCQYSVTTTQLGCRMIICCLSRNANFDLCSIPLYMPQGC